MESDGSGEWQLEGRAVVEDADAEQTKAISAEQLATILALIPDRHLLLFRFLAATGLRISELVALQWQHLALDGSTPHVKVRRALVKGRMGPPKSRHGRRSVPLDAGLSKPCERLGETRSGRATTTSRSPPAMARR